VPKRAPVFDFTLKLQVRRLPRVKTRKLAIVRTPRRVQNASDDSGGSNDDQRKVQVNGITEEPTAPVSIDTETASK